MVTKMLEIRDAATFIPCLAIAISGNDGFLARRAGFDHQCIQIIHFASGRSSYDPFEWNDRTMRTAHQYIEDQWASLSDHDVIDVQFILGETQIIKKSESETVLELGFDEGPFERVFRVMP